MRGILRSREIDLAAVDGVDAHLDRAKVAGQARNPRQVDHRSRIARLDCGVGEGTCIGRHFGNNKLAARWRRGSLR